MINNQFLLLVLISLQFVVTACNSTVPFREQLTEDNNMSSIPFEHPSARTGSRMIYDSKREVVVLFGGNEFDGKYFDDTWEYDGVIWIQK
ncbi:MAG: hypothetical protein DWQ04_21720 [Chloroflexi bacterium]|nr:MAG: hypothetical protein DWQ04_21720 [Chloroflexota bacterium]